MYFFREGVGGEIGPHKSPYTYSKGEVDLAFAFLGKWSGSTMFSNETNITDFVVGMYLIQIPIGFGDLETASDLGVFFDNLGDSIKGATLDSSKTDFVTVPNLRCFDASGLWFFRFDVLEKTETLQKLGLTQYEDPNEPKDFRKTIHRILHVQYAIPENI
ncbi:hypothetical protein Tco_1214420 [Tanacetum coccineum]